MVTWPVGDKILQPHAVCLRVYIYLQTHQEVNYVITCYVINNAGMKIVPLKNKYLRCCFGDHLMTSSDQHSYSCKPVTEPVSTHTH